MSHFLTRSLQERLDLVEPEGASAGQVLKAVDIDGVIIFQPGEDASGDGGAAELNGLSDVSITLAGDATDTGLMLQYDHEHLDGAGWYAVPMQMPIEDPMAPLDAAAKEAADGKILQWVWDPDAEDGAGAGAWEAQDAPAGETDHGALNDLTDVSAVMADLTGGEVLTFIPAMPEHGAPEDEDYAPATDAHFAMQASMDEGGSEAGLCAPEELISQPCDSTTVSLDLSDGGVVYLMSAWSLAEDGSEVCAVSLTLGGDVTVGRHCFIVDDGLEAGRMIEVTVAGGAINGSVDPVELSDNATVHLLCTSFSDPMEAGDGSSTWVIL